MTEISNFRMTAISGNTALDRMYFGTVLETTTSGHLWWKLQHARTREIARAYTGHWFYTDTGERALEGYALERVWSAQQAKANARLLPP